MACAPRNLFIRARSLKLPRSSSAVQAGSSMTSAALLCRMFIGAVSLYVSPIHAHVTLLIRRSRFRQETQPGEEGQPDTLEVRGGLHQTFIRRSYTAGATENSTSEASRMSEEQT